VPVNAATRTTPTNFDIAATCTTFDGTSGVVKDVIVGDTITITDWGTCNRTSTVFWDSSWFTWSGATTGGQSLPPAPAVLTVTSVTSGVTKETRVDRFGSMTNAFVIGVTGLVIAPDVPIINSITPGNRSVSVDFTAGADNGDPILTYDYQIDGNGWAVINSTISPLVISQLSDGSNQPLANGTTYSISIRARNSSVSGPNTTTQSFTPNPVAPGAPTLNSSTIANQSTDIDFTVTDDGGDVVTNVEYSTDNGASWTTPSPAVTTSPIRITGLTNGTSYDVKLRAVNSVGSGTASAALSLVPDGLPSAPSLVGASPADGRVLVSFTPGSDRGVPISNYEYELDGSGTWTAISPATSSSPVTITGLTNGTTYSVKLRAVNAVGSGAASGAQNATPAGTPGAPTNLVATRSDGQISVAYTAASGNGSPVSFHEYSTDGGITWSGLCPPAAMPPTMCGNPLVVTKESGAPNNLLVNGTPYTVSIRGRNAVGSGASAGVTATPATLPAVPTIASVTPGNGKLVVDFTVGSDGGAAITAVEWSTDGNIWNSGSPATTTSPITLTGLTNGWAYTVSLRAVNGVGASNGSPFSPGRPAKQVPSTPSGVLVSGGNSSANVSFILGDDGGDPLTNIEYSIDGGTSWVTPSPAVTSSPLAITGLTNGTAYSVSIRPVNGVGAAVATSPLSATAGIQAPSQVTGVLATADNQSAVVSFTAPADNGSPISYYEYSIDGGSTWTSGSPAVTSSPFTIAGLTNGNTYSVSVRALNGVGTGIASATSLVTPAAQVPSTPTGINVIAGNQSATVTFTAGAANGSAITNYEYSTDGGSTWVVPSPAVTASPLIITGLTNGTTFNVAIRPVNGIGTGAATSNSPVTPATQVPAIPASVNVAAGHESVTVTFGLGDDGGDPVSNIEYSTDGGATWIAPSPSVISSPLLITGLTNGTTYAVSIRPVNGVGASGPTSAATVTPAAQLPSTPTGVNVTPGNRSATVTFTAGAANGSAITNYQYSTDGGSTWMTPSPAVTSSPLIIPSLTNGNNYSVAIRAVNSVGAGIASATSLVTPAAQVPSTPTGINVIAGNHSATVTFTAGAANGSAITNYEYSTDGGSTWVVPSPAVTASPLIITGLTNGTTYNVVVRAVNGVGTSTPTSTSAVTPTAQVPGSPTGVNITPSAKQLTVSFTLGSDGGSPVTNIEYSLDGGVTWVTPSPAVTSSPLVISGLTNGTTYRVALRPINAVGSAVASSNVSATPTATPITISIKGLRSDRLIGVRGTTTGIATGTALIVRIDVGFSGTYGIGVAEVRVQADGSFTWKRLVRRGSPAKVRFELGSYRSNRLVLP
jgi:titin